MQYVVLAVALLLAVNNWFLYRSLKRDIQRVDPERLIQLVDELVATAEEAAAAVAERTERLQAVITRADSLSAELRGHTARAAAMGSGGQAAAASAGRGRPGAAGPLQKGRADAEAKRAELPGAMNRPDGAPVQQEPERVAAEAPRVKAWEPAELSPVAEPPQPDQSRSEIYALADAGVDSQGIARKLGMTRGEVELILGLRRLN